MRPGETQKISCDCCAKDFEITLEPDCPHANEATPEICPFCGYKLPDEVESDG